MDGRTCIKKPLEVSLVEARGAVLSALDCCGSLELYTTRPEAEISRMWMSWSLLAQHAIQCHDDGGPC